MYKYYIGMSVHADLTTLLCKWVT